MTKGQKSFSNELETWLKSRGSKTIAELNKVFGDRTFAILIFLLMFVPALPLPTGGISHIFEIIAMLLALEMIIGRQTIWLPEKWQQKELGSLATGKVLPRLSAVINWLENHSSQRLLWLMNWRWTENITGLLIFIFCLTAFLSPPFSGLDTIPSIGVELLVLGLILRDGLFLIIGAAIGAMGVGAVIFLSELVLDFIRGL